jgi:hypothetical protein
MDGKTIRTHGSKALREFLFHGIDGCVDTHQCHDTKRDDSHGNTSAEFVAPHRSKGK